MTTYCCLPGRRCKACLAWLALKWAHRDERGDVKYKRKPSPSKQDTIVDEESPRADS